LEAAFRAACGCIQQQFAIGLYMTLRIIKSGTARAVGVQQFPFSEDSREAAFLSDPSIYPEFEAAPGASPLINSVPAEPAGPAIDLAYLEKTAFETGFAQGEKAGIEIGEKQIEATMGRYRESILELGRLRSSVYAQVEREVVKLAIEVARKIVHREIQVDKAIIQTLVRVALSHVSEKSAMTVRLNPVDYSFLLEQRNELSENEGCEISLLSDKSIERGGCLVQTECGDIDARIEEKFKEVENSFFEGMK
jgi:flagellar assembly protein FliH